MSQQSPITHFQFGLMIGSIPAAFAEYFVASSYKADEVGWWFPTVITLSVGLLFAWSISALVQRNEARSTTAAVGQEVGRWARALIMLPLALGFFLSALMVCASSNVWSLTLF